MDFSDSDSSDFDGDGPMVNRKSSKTSKFFGDSDDAPPEPFSDIDRDLGIVVENQSIIEKCTETNGNLSSDDVKSDGNNALNVDKDSNESQNNLGRSTGTSDLHNCSEEDEDDVATIQEIDDFEDARESEESVECTPVPVAPTASETSNIVVQEEIRNLNVENVKEEKDDDLELLDKLFFGSGSGSKSDQGTESDKSSVDNKTFNKNIPMTPDETWDFSMRALQPELKSKFLWIEGTFYQKLTRDCLHEMVMAPCPCENPTRFTVCRLCHMVFCGTGCFKQELKEQIGTTRHKNRMEGTNALTMPRKSDKQGKSSIARTDEVEESNTSKEIESESPKNSTETNKNERSSSNTNGKSDFKEAKPNSQNQRSQRSQRGDRNQLPQQQQQQRHHNQQQQKYNKKPHNYLSPQNPCMVPPPPQGMWPTQVQYSRAAGPGLMGPRPLPPGYATPVPTANPQSVQSVPHHRAVVHGHYPTTQVATNSAVLQPQQLQQTSAKSNDTGNAASSQQILNMIKPSHQVQPSSFHQSQIRYPLMSNVNIDDACLSPPPTLPNRRSQEDRLSPVKLLRNPKDKNEQEQQQVEKPHVPDDRSQNSQSEEYQRSGGGKRTDTFYNNHQGTNYREGNGRRQEFSNNDNNFGGGGDQSQPRGGERYEQRNGNHYGGRSTHNQNQGSRRNYDAENKRPGYNNRMDKSNARKLRGDYKDSSDNFQERVGNSGKPYHNNNRGPRTSSGDNDDDEDIKYHLRHSPSKSQSYNSVPQSGGNKAVQWKDNVHPGPPILKRNFSHSHEREDGEFSSEQLNKLQPAGGSSEGTNNFDQRNKKKNFHEGEGSIHSARNPSREFGSGRNQSNQNRTKESDGSQSSSSQSSYYTAQQSHSNSNSEFHSTNSSCSERDNTNLIASVADIPIGIYFEVKHVRGNNFDDFVVMPMTSENQKAVDTITKALQVVGKKQMYMFEVGDYCIVNYSDPDNDVDGEWHRGVITKVVNKVWIYVLDLGLVIGVDQTSVFEMPSELMRYKPTVVRMNAINILANMSDPDVRDYYSSLVKHKIIKIKITHKIYIETALYCGYLQVSHLGKWFDVGALLEKFQVAENVLKKFAEEKLANTKEYSPIGLTIPIDELKLSCTTIEAKIRYAASLNEFYITTKESMKIIFGIETKLNDPTFLADCKPVQSLQDLSASLFTVYCDKEESYVRVKILEVREIDGIVSATVKKVDHGDIVTVSIQDLKSLPATLHKPSGVFKCSLPVKAAPKSRNKSKPSVSFDSLTKFLSEIYEKPVKFVVFSLEEEKDNYIVELFVDDAITTGLCSYLINQDWATLTHDVDLNCRKKS